MVIINPADYLVNKENPNLFLHKALCSSLSQAPNLILTSTCFQSNPSNCIYPSTFFDVHIQPIINYGKISPLLELYCRIVFMLLKLWTFVPQNQPIYLLSLMMRRHLMLKHDFSVYMNKVYQQLSGFDICFCYLAYIMTIYHVVSIKL